jgi:hypothetical protein
MRPSKSLGLLAAFIGLFVAVGAPAVAENPAGDIDAKQVRQAIDKGVAYLERAQDPHSGSWPDHATYVGGTTALCTLALLNCGVPVHDEHIQKALNFLRPLKPTMTYPVSLQTMVLCMAEPEKDFITIRNNAKWLEETQIKEGPRRGAWSYPGIGGGDNSNSQFALLALYEAERAGVSVPLETWKMALDYWKSAQNADGSFNYYKVPGARNPPASGSMTCAGLTSLVIASGRLSAGDAQAQGDQIRCCGSEDAADDSTERIASGLQWLGRRDIFTIEQNPNVGSQWHYYFLYGLERLGRMTAQRFIGGRDWYREGAAFLVSPAGQQLNGQWQGREGIETDPNITTSFALLFLGKGRRPILMAKVEHGPGTDWNHHRNDVANLTSFVETRWKKEFPLGLSWQVVDLAHAKVEDLLQSPVIYLSGSQVPEIDEHQGQVLRDYIDRGGFLFAEACCDDGAGFDRGFRALVRRIFPPEYQLRVLPPEHPIWHAEEKVPAEQQRTLLGIDYGCRTSVVYFPPPKAGDPPHGLSCCWELGSGHGRTLSPAVAAQVASANIIGINVLAYATNRELKSKEENFTHQTEKPTDDNFDRGKLYIVKLRHPGGCDTAPAALPNLLQAAARELQIRVNTDQRMIDITDPALFKYHLAFMHGRRAFRFTDAERKQLRLFLHRGGTLLADSICANPEFTNSFRAEMKAIFAGDADVASKDQPLTAIPPKDALFTREFGGYDLSTVTLRQPQGSGENGRETASLRKIPPELEGVKIGDRYAVIFSKFDLSCALEKHDSLECEGYTRDDAERIGLNVLLYSLHQ